MISKDKIFSLILCCGAFLIACGCSDQPPATIEGAAKKPFLPVDLQKIQGSWRQVSSNSYPMCELDFDEYTVRLRYRKSEEELLKRNAQIHSIDMERGQLNVYGDDAPWLYSMDRQKGEEQLIIQFYNIVDLEWVQLRLVKSESNVSRKTENKSASMAGL